MEQKDKELLLKDLCARLFYGVKVCIKIPNHQEKIFEEQIGDLKELTRYGGYLVNSKGIDYRSFNLDIKPYLRPMSSMTEEEAGEYFSICTGSIRGDMIAKIDFYIKHHFDFRLTSEGLSMIEAGLALEALNGMYK